MNYLILTHGGCMDGICAAMIAHRWACAQKDLEDDETVEVRQCDYGAPFDPADGKGKFVIVTDFAFPRNVMVEIARASDEFVWLDHHASNQALIHEWRDVSSMMTVKRNDGRCVEIVNSHKMQGSLSCVFDLDRSGAGIAWDYFFPGRTRPWLVDYVEDRDLWRFKLPDSREINCVVQAAPKTIKSYEALLCEPLDLVRHSGRNMLSYLSAWAVTVADNARPISFCGHKDVPIATCTYSGIADVLEVMCKRSPSGVAVAWLQRSDGMFQYSLRSDGRVDVSLLAKKFGGGGHHNAAGFQSKKLFPWDGFADWESV